LLIKDDLEITDMNRYTHEDDNPPFAMVGTQCDVVHKTKDKKLVDVYKTQHSANYSKQDVIMTQYPIVITDVYIPYIALDHIFMNNTCETIKDVITPFTYDPLSISVYVGKSFVLHDITCSSRTFSYTRYDLMTPMKIDMFKEGFSFLWNTQTHNLISEIYLYTIKMFKEDDKKYHLFIELKTNNKSFPVTYVQMWKSLTMHFPLRY
jgi:hypothetical protein